MANQFGYERQGNGNASKSWSMRFFLLAINVFLFFIILGIDALRIWGLGFMGLSVVILLFNFMKNRMNSKRVVNDNPRDLFPLLSKYLRINRKYLLASIIGLSLALVVISQVIILANSGSGNIYQEAFPNGEVNAFEARAEGYDYMGNPVTNNFSTIRSEVMNAFQETANEHGLVVEDLQIEYRYRFYLNLPRPDTVTEGEYYDDRMWLSSSSITEDDLKELRLFPTFPSDIVYSENMSLLAYESWFFDRGDYTANDTIAGQSTFNFTASREETNFTMPISHTWKITDQDRDYAYRNSLWRLLNDVEQSVVVAQGQDVEIFGDYMSSFSDQMMNGYIDIDSLKGMDPEDALTAFEDIESSIQAIVFQNNLNGWVYSDAGNEIRWAQQNEILIRFVLFLIALPMLGIALYLVYFSLNLVELRKQNLVSIMKIRGISSGQLKFIMTIESLIAALIAAVIGMIASVPWSQYILDSTEIYGEDAVAYITPEWYWTIPVIAIILAIDLNIGSILTISTTSVEEGEASEEQKEPFWRRLYLDVILTVVGVGIWVVIRTVPSARGNPTILLTALWCLPALAIGLPLFISRYYSSFLTILSDFLWKREGNLFALATRNMRRNKFSASKLAVLLMIGMMFSFVALSVPHSLTSWSADSAHYSVGSDFQINNIDRTNQTHLEILENRTDISDYSIYHAAQIPANQRTYNGISVLGINTSTFADAAFWDSSYASSSLSKLMDIIEEGKILVLDQGLEILSKEVGDDLVLYGAASEFGSSTTIIEEVGGSFKYWPNLLNQLPYSDDWLYEVPVVMSIDSYLDYFNETSANVYAKASGGANQTLIYEELDATYSNHTGAGGGTINVYSAENYLLEFSEADEIVLLFSMLDTLLIVTVLTSFIGVGYFSFITLAERRREIGVFRAVGMVSKQIFILLVVESVILVTSSLLIGIGAGSFISSNLFVLMGSEALGSVPPIELRYPPLLTGGFVLVTLVLSVLAAAIPARSTATKQTGSILRAE